MVGSQTSADLALTQRQLARRRWRISILIVVIGGGWTFLVYLSRGDELRQVQRLEAERVELDKVRQQIERLPALIASMERAILAKAGLIQENPTPLMALAWWQAQTSMRQLDESFGEGDPLRETLGTLSGRFDAMRDFFDHIDRTPASPEEARRLLSQQTSISSETDEACLRAIEAISHRIGASERSIEKARMTVDELYASIFTQAFLTLGVLIWYLVASFRFATRERLRVQLRDTQEHLNLALQDLEGSQPELVDRERKRLLGEVAESVAHELRNVLMPISAMSELLLDDRSLNSEQRRSVETIRTSCQDAAVILANMKGYIGVVGQASQMRSIDLCDLLRQVVEFTRPKWEVEARRRKVKIEIDLQLPSKLSVTGVDTELRQVFTNVLFNAIEAMATSGTIRISAARERQRVLVSIRDEGQGFADLDRMVGATGGSTKPTGLGIGLKVCRQIVRAYRGTIEFHTADGIGTTCDIRLPADQHSKQRAAEPSKLPNYAGMQVLCVDDDPAVLESLAALLRSLGTIVSVADNGDAAIAEQRHKRFEVVLCDLGLGSENGLDVLQKLAGDNKELTTVLITGWDGGSWEQHSFSPNFILAKPATREQLCRVLDAARNPV